MLRIAHRRSAERCLVRGFRGQIVDLAFANIARDVIFAAVDEVGGVYVYEVFLGIDGKVKYPCLVGFFWSIIFNSYIIIIIIIIVYGVRRQQYTIKITVKHTIKLQVSVFFSVP